MMKIIIKYFPFCQISKTHGFRKQQTLGFPWWLSVQESACQCRRHGLDLWSGKIPRAAGQLHPHTPTIKPVL